MMKASSFIAAIALLSLAPLACNPDCESLQGVQISSSEAINGYEIRITANPISSLEGRQVFFDDVLVKKEDTEFVSDFGLIIRVPMDVPVGPVAIRIEDPDCLDVFTYNFNVVTADYFNTIETYSPPIPPEIIIPTPPPSFPISVDQAWLSADDPGYCLWFIMYKDSLPDGTIDTTSLIDPDNSFEQSTCGCLQSSNLPYARNRMGGIIDKEHNLIEVYIDRSAREGGDIEYFTGTFIDENQTPYVTDKGTLNCPDPCLVQGAKPPATGHMLLLTSKKTGRQVVAYQKVP